MWILLFRAQWDVIYVCTLKKTLNVMRACVGISDFSSLVSAFAFILSDVNLFAVYIVIISVNEISVTGLESFFKITISIFQYCMNIS